ncbi:MAG: efflux RND transporter permease subunit [Rhodoferax sp.]|nr:efflux RND transporter permease subunit [Rhodoferax sp.]MCF8210406.1 efflux RND transporter permease subunit [Rhodoferax sp.]
MWITKTSINQPVFATMVMLALMLLGVISYTKLGVEQMPDIQVPGVWMQVRYPGASPEQVEADLIKPLEEVVNTVTGVSTIFTNSFEGRGELWIEFQLSTKMDKAVQDIRDKVAQMRPLFPRDAKDPLIVRGQFDGAEPTSTFAILSKTRSLRELSTLTDQQIVKRLQGISGVGQVVVGGNVQRQVQVSLKPHQMQAYQVGIDEVLRAIREVNQDLPAGSLRASTEEQLVRVEGKLKSVEAFRQIIVARRAGVPVLLEQVATVSDGEREEQSIGRVNGQKALTIGIFKTQDANLVAVGEEVAKTMERLRKQLPADVEIRSISENASFVKNALDSVKRTIVEGGLLTILIVFLFLHSWRSTLITGVTLPISVLSTFIAMYAFGFTINSITLMALSLCIGLLIDDAIVVRENIVRHVGMGKSHLAAARDGTEEIGLAVLATTLAICAVFVPVAFMSGIIGKIFFQFGITVTVAVLVSLFVSFTLDPMLSSVWKDPVATRFSKVPWLGRLMERVEHGVEWLHRVYGRLLHATLQRRKTTLALAAVIFSGSLGLLPLVGGEFMPKSDQGVFPLKIKTPVGTSLSYTDAKVFQVEEALRSFPEIELISTTIGTNNRNEAELLIKLTDQRSTQRRSQTEVEKAVRERLKRIAGIELSVGFNKPIWINLIGPASDALPQVLATTMAKVGAVKGVVDLEHSLQAANPAVLIKVNAAVASDLGLSVERIGSALRPFVNGDQVSNWLAPDGQNYEVNVQLPRSGRSKLSDLGDLPIATGRLDAQGTPIMVPLRQVVEFVPSTSPQVIKRQNLERRVGIYAGVEGRPAGDVAKEVKKAVQSIDLPPGYRFDIKGEAEQNDEAGAAAAVALVLAVVFIYFILASQFASFLQPIAIMASLPFTLVGVMAALILTGSTLNLFSIIGFIMLMGLVVKNAILLVDFANHSQRAGMNQFEAVLNAGQVRLRPIIMTTLAMIFGMLPMAIGLGEGAEVQAPMGRAVIGGLITSTLLTLVVVPVLYTYLDNLPRWWRRRFAT